MISIFENKYKIAILYASYPLQKHYIHEYNKIIHDIEKEKTLNWWSIAIVCHVMENKNLRQYSGLLTLCLPEIFTSESKGFRKVTERHIGLEDGTERVKVRAKETSKSNSGALQFSCCFVLHIEFCKITSILFKLKSSYLIPNLHV